MIALKKGKNIEHKNVLEQRVLIETQRGVVRMCELKVFISVCCFADS